MMGFFIYLIKVIFIDRWEFTDNYLTVVCVLLIKKKDN